MISVLCQIRSKIISDVYKKSLIAFDNMALKLKLKCHLTKDDVAWLGHKVSGAGVTPDKEKFFAICQWQTLTTIKEVQTFLVVCGWWRNIVPNYCKPSL